LGLREICRDLPLVRIRALFAVGDGVVFLQLSSVSRFFRSGAFMSIWYAMLLGVVQGLTEFLPVSSSGHLVVAQNLLGFTEPELVLDVILHLGTLVAVLVHFRADIQKIALDMLRHPPIGPKGSLPRLVLLATIPAVVFGLTLSSPIEALFADIRAVGFFLLCTGVVLLLPKVLSGWLEKRKKQRDPNLVMGRLEALLIGVAQAFAILPGISRSGMTITTGILCGLDRETAGRFAFLLSIPIILGATLQQLISVENWHLDAMPLCLGFLASAVTGYVALRFMMRLVRAGSLSYFGPYCLVLGVIVIFL
jgi:undecaprenyl-diphosphatase